MCFDIKSKIDDLTLTSTWHTTHFGEISAIEQADDVHANSRCALQSSAVTRSGNRLRAALTIAGMIDRRAGRARSGDRSFDLS